MRIPNKFNGYSRDGIRLYNDPATATITIASMGQGAAIASSLGAAGLLGTVGTSMLGAGALAEGAALGSALYGTGVSSSGIASLLPGQTAAAASPIAQTGLASNFSAPNYLAQLGNAGVTPVAETAALTPFQTATNASIQSALQSTPTALNPVATMQAPINAVPQLSNASNVFTAAQQPVSSSGIQSLAQGRGFVPVESVTAAPVTSAPVTSANQIASGYTANPYIANPPVAAPVVAAPAPATVVTTPTTAPIVEAPAFQPPVENSLLSPSATTPADFKLATSTSSPTNYDALGNIDKATGDKIAQANKAMQGRGMTGSAWQDFKTLASKPNWANIKEYASEHPYETAAGVYALYNLTKPKAPKMKEEDVYIRPYENTRMVNPNVSYYRPYSGGSTAERTYFTGGLEALPIYRAAEGGIASLAVGGQVETMSAANAIGANFDYPQARLQTPLYSDPYMQRPKDTNIIKSGTDTNVDPYTGEEKFADGGKTTGGYKYSYDPKTMQFTQLSEPTIAPSGPVTQAMGMNGIYQQPQQPVVQKPFVPVVSGGMSPPAIQSAPQFDQYMQSSAPINIPAYQTTEQRLGLDNFYDYMNQQLAGMRNPQGMASGGLSHLGGYSDGGRLLRGPGDGVSDSIPASIGDRQPARLADGEFVVPARIVSEIGNGSTEAGARKLYAMMDRVQKARKKSVGKQKVAVDSRADKYLPA
jgi:hypothetical protein